MRYAALAIFLGLLAAFFATFASVFPFANGDAALPARINAHLFLTASRIALRPAALIVRFFVVGFGTPVGFASPFRFAAHLNRIRSDAAFLWAAENLRPCFLGAGAAAEIVTVSGFFGGRPMRFVGPWRASMARLSLSLSATKRGRICSVGIQGIVARWSSWNQLWSVR